MAEKMFYKDPYMKEFRAKVERIDGNKVVLDRTCFYGTNGGQLGDSGTLNGEKVEVTEIEDGEIVHIMENPPSFKEGEEVSGVLIWDERYKKMRLHSAVHIVHFVAEKLLGKKKVIGSNVYSQKARIDYLMEDAISKEAIEEISRELADLVSKDLPIETGFSDGEKRFWRIEGFPDMPCGGTHLKKTGEIGEVKIKRKNLGKGKERLEVTLIS
jgi:alanyl-tRNA synthetase